MFLYHFSGNKVKRITPCIFPRICRLKNLVGTSELSLFSTLKNNRFDRHRRRRRQQGIIPSGRHVPPTQLSYRRLDCAMSGRDASHQIFSPNLGEIHTCTTNNNLSTVKSNTRTANSTQLCPNRMASSCLLLVLSFSEKKNCVRHVPSRLKYA